MSWSDYMQLIRKQSTSLEDWQAADPRTVGFTLEDTQRQLGAAIYDVLDTADNGQQTCQALSGILLAFIDQAGKAAALRQQVEDLEREAREAADMLAAAQERNEYLEAALASARTEVLFLQDRVAPQSTHKGLQGLFQRRQEIEDVIQCTAEAVFAPGVTVYWEHNGHMQCGRVKHVERGLGVWVVNINTNVTRCLDIWELRTEAAAADVVYSMEAADVA